MEGRPQEATTEEEASWKAQAVNARTPARLPVETFAVSNDRLGNGGLFVYPLDGSARLSSPCTQRSPLTPGRGIPLLFAFR